MGCRPFPQPAPKLLSLCRHEDWCIYTVTRDGEMIEGCNADTLTTAEKSFTPIWFSPLKLISWLSVLVLI